MSKARFTSPAGTAQYPWLQPGRPDTAFDAEGKYKVQLKVSPENAGPLKEILENVKSESFGAKDKVMMPMDQDHETGEIVFKFQSKYEPKYFDAKGHPIPRDQVPAMYGGSTLRVSGIADGYTSAGKKGISLRLGAVQVIDPVSSGGGDGGDFDAVEGGYVANTVTGAQSFETKDAEEDNYDF